MPEAKRKAKPNWHGTLHELLSTILAFDEKAREQALDRQCADDPRLKAEILSLCQTLPAIDANPVLEANQTIANRFVVLDRLGRGGMGEVYRARDLHLDRVVAIKVLRARAVGDPESRRRMENEARALSSLAHPRICALYDLYFEVSSPVLVMEYLEGDTLDSRLESGPMPLAAIFETAFQILDALSYAHERGVVHCDLKPSNVMLTPSGAKVLDFGVAKRFLTPTPQVAIENLALADAQTNLLFGTPSYMSPEQALGKALDARSDLFSFGALLYEMTTRKRAFSGDTAISTLAAVLTTEPKPARQLNSAAPRELEGFIRRCLEKEPAGRFGNARQALAALEGIRGSTTRHLWRQILFVSVITLFALLSGFFWWRNSLGRRDTPKLTLTRLTGGEVVTSVSLSPDGKRVVYSSDRSGSLHLWLQELAGREPVRLTTDTPAEMDPVFSPDGSVIAFRSDQDGGGIYVISASGRNKRLIAPGGRDPSYSPDGKWIAYWEGLPSEGDVVRAGSARSFVVPATGGAPRQIARDLINPRHPVFSPDGQQLLVLGVKSVKARRGDEIYSLVDLGTGRSKELTVTKEFADRGLPDPSIQVWTKTGIFFSVGGGRGDDVNIWYAPVSTDLTVTGTPEALTSGMSETSHVAIGGRKLAFYSGEEQNAIWLLPVETNLGKPLGPIMRAVSRPGIMAHPYLSPDGKRLLVRVFSKRGTDLILRDLKTGQERLIAQRDRPELAGRFLADNSTVLFESGKPGEATVTQWDLGTGKRDELFKRGSALGPSASGRWISYGIRQDNGSNSIWVAERGTGAAAEILSDDHSQMYVSHFSPDERWISFLAREGPEQSRIFIAPFRGLNPIPNSQWVLISQGKDDKPEWSPNGRLLYYLSDRDGYRCIWAQRVSPKDKRPVGAAFPVQHFHELRLSMLNVNLGHQEVSVARDKMAFMLSEQSGGIWVADLPRNIQ